MNMKFIPITLLLAILGCSHLEPRTEKTHCKKVNSIDFSGCWITTECKKTIHKTTKAVKWINSQYNFTPEGILAINFYEYSDSLCTVLTGVGRNKHFPYIRYEKLGVVENSDGLIGSRIKLNIGASSYGSTFDVKGAIYIVGNEKLCSSKSFNFGAGNFRFSKSGNAKENKLYDGCLSRGNLP